MAHLLAFEVAVESIEEEAVVGDREPVKDFLFLLGADALVFEEEIQERGLYSYIDEKKTQRKTQERTLGSSSEASTPGLRLRRSLKTPSSNFFMLWTGRPNA